MTERLSIAFVDDEPEVVDGLADLLRPRREQWDMSFHTDPRAALEALDGVDAIVTDVRMPVMDGVALLEAVAERHPDVVRIVLSGQTDPATARRAAAIAHRTLAKPCRPDDLAQAIDGTLLVRDELHREGLRLADAGLDRLPRAPKIVSELHETLADPRCDATAIAEVVRRDVALTARLLALVNSAYFGLARRVESVEEAVAFLGEATVEAMTLQHAVLGLRPPAPAADLEAFEAHARLVGRIARDLAAPGFGPAAFAAGLLHDVGVLVLATVDPFTHHARLASAAEHEEPLHLLEARERGASHAVTGAHLLELWEVPPALVDAVALHHAPEADVAGELPRVVRLAEQLAHGLEATRTTALYRHGDPTVAVSGHAGVQAWCDLVDAGEEEQAA